MRLPSFRNKAFLAIGLVVPGILIYFYLRYGNQVQFDPATFINQYWNFVLDLVVIFFGFLLVNVYWEYLRKKDESRRQIEQKQRRSIRGIAGYIDQIIAIADDLLRKFPLKDEDFPDHLREQIRNLSQAKDSINPLFIAFELLEPSEPNPIETKFRETVEPYIIDFENMDPNRVRVNAALAEKIKLLHANARELAIFLRHF